MDLADLAPLVALSDLEFDNDGFIVAPAPTKPIPVPITFRRTSRVLKPTMKTEPPQSPQPLARGHHLRARPDMSQHARAAQLHWRLTAERFKKPSLACFERQMVAARKRHLKCQQICILGLLQKALEDRLITAKILNSKMEESFCGWKNFRIHPEHALEFQGRLWDIFPAESRQATVNNAFRRAGLIPQCHDDRKCTMWIDAWSGVNTFAYMPTRRALYS